MPIFQLLKDKYTPDTLPYHLIVPSLPGYAFSSGPGLDKDFGIEDASRVLDRLMSLLGFGDGYVAQGGDIGSRVARYLAATYHSCKGKIQSARSLH
jgi:microsomal epoxide hydrolase